MAKATPLFTFLIATALASAGSAKPTYQDLDANYPLGAPCQEPDSSGHPKWKNQCAIRLSIAINKEGSWTVSKSTYDEPTCAHGHARGAQELATWLGASSRLGKPSKHAPTAAANQIGGRKGIVFIKNCFTRPGQTTKIGDHIDLWDGAQLQTAPNSLLTNGQEVWFWPLP